jgi:hypothetical protein
MEAVALWIGVGVVRWFIWNKQVTEDEIYHESEKLKFQISHLVLFCVLGPLWLVSIIRNLF